MNKSFYFLASCFTIMFFLVGLLQSILFLQLGSEIYFLESFPAWFIVASISQFASTAFLLKYFYLQNYKLAFITGIISLFVNLLYSIITFIIVVTRTLEHFYFPLSILVLLTGIVFASSLIFSSARKKFWLRVGGVLLISVGIVLLVSYGWSLGNPSPQLYKTLEVINQWTSLILNLFPIALVLNFLQEYREEREKAALSITFDNVTAISGMLIFTFALALGGMIQSETYWKVKYHEGKEAREEKLIQKFESYTFVNDKGDSLKYLLLKPLEYDPRKKYPLVVSLPPNGFDGAQAAEVLSEDENRKKYPSFLFIPHCPANSGWGGIPHYPNIASLIIETINSLNSAYSIDPKRRYVTGISRGGFGSWFFISTHPEMFAAAIPVCGGGDPKLAENISDVSVWAFHGAKDKNVPVSGSRDIIAAMKKQGQSPRYTEYPNHAHNIWDKVIKTPGILDWLFSQKKN